MESESRKLTRTSSLDELETVMRLARAVDGDLARAEVIGEIPSPHGTLPSFGFTLGTAPPEAPVLILVGGVHGLERIGAQVVIAYLETLLERLRWDRMLRAHLEHARVAFVPLVNPVGMLRRTRANGAGVDLMRNAPPHPDSWGTPLVGGQRWSPRLPWYMGPPNAPVQPELRALLAFLDRVLLPSRAAIAVDVHSGFGMVDRLWFPYARTRKPLPHLAEVLAIHRLLDDTLPNHVYRMEPQAQAYTIVGDVWDHLYDVYRDAHPEGAFVPLTLELGSWLWVKKNPRQLFSRLGGFNPMRPHRLRRALRRHIPLFDLLHRAVGSPEAWISADEVQREARTRQAFERWYGG